MVTIDGFPIDAAISESYEYQSEVPEDPVESGADISDHVRNKPPDVVLESIVSDRPIGAIADERSTTSLPSEDALAMLMRIRDARQPVTIEASLGVYADVVLKSLIIPRDRSTGRALRFRAVFKQIRIVNVQRTTIRVSVPRAQKKQKRGSKATKTNDTASALGGTQMPGAFGLEVDDRTHFERFTGIRTNWGR